MVKENFVLNQHVQPVAHAAQLKVLCSSVKVFTSSLDIDNLPLFW